MKKVDRVSYRLRYTRLPENCEQSTSFKTLDNAKKWLALHILGGKNIPQISGKFWMIEKVTTTTIVSGF